MLMTRFAVIVSCVMAAAASPATCQDYPNKPVRLVTSGVGGGLDILARLIAPGLVEGLGQQISSTIAAASCPRKSSPRHSPMVTRLLVAGGTFATAPLIQKTPYDPVRDFAPVSLVSSAPSVLVVTASLPANSVKDLIALAKSKPGSLNYSTSSIGSSAQLGMELLKSMAGVDIVLIQYKGGAAEMTDLIAGRVQMTISTPATVAPHIKAGRLKALGVTSIEPSSMTPGVPPVASVLPGFELISIMGILAPARTPDAIVKRLSAEIGRAVNRSDVKQKLFDTGLEAVGSAPQSYAAAIKSQMTTLGKVIKEANIRAE
jgi:tripartite-type tricarboxylate transporter receptor subunit TctC